MIEAVLERIRGRRREAARSITQQYWEMVSALAAGDEIDIDFLGEVLESLGKTESHLSADVEKIQERTPYQSELARLRAVQSTIPKLRAAKDRAAAELDAAYQRLQPLVAETHAALTAAENEVSRIGWLEDRLVETAADPTLAERRTTLTVQRREIGEQLRPLADSQRLTEQYVRAYGDAIDKFERQRREAGSYDVVERTRINRELNQQKLNFASAEKRLHEINAEIREHSAQVSDIDSQLESLRMEMINS